ncbi:hypothetical protein MRX96_025227 [Rhipicephalus microplus]
MFRLGGLFSPERHMTCIGYGVRFADNRCTMPETETDYFYGQLGYRSLKANRDQSFMIIKTLQETKGNAYAFIRTIKKMLTTRFKGKLRLWPCGEMCLQLLLVQKHAGITVLEQAFELLEQDLFAQLDKLLVPRVRTCQGSSKGQEAEEQMVLDRTLVSTTAACPADPQNHRSLCKSSRREAQPHLIDDELNEAFQRGCVFDQQATNDWACCPVVDRQCA